MAFFGARLYILCLFGAGVNLPGRVALGTQVALAAEKALLAIHALPREETKKVHKTMDQRLVSGYAPG